MLRCSPNCSALLGCHLLRLVQTLSQHLLALRQPAYIVRSPCCRDSAFASLRIIASTLRVTFHLQTRHNTPYGMHSDPYPVDDTGLCAAGSLLVSFSTTTFGNVHSSGGSDIIVRACTAPREAFAHRLKDLFSAGLDTGVAFATIIIFFALSYNNITLDWWGNTVGDNTCKSVSRPSDSPFNKPPEDDGLSVPWKSVPAGAHFGPGPGEF